MKARCIPIAPCLNNALVCPSMRDLLIGRQSAAFIARGHPWLRKDRFTGSLAGLSDGDVVTLMDEQRRPLASALIDRQHPTICARVFHRSGNRSFDPIAACERAFEQRGALLADSETTCLRLIHGEGDYLPGLRVERLGDALHVVVMSAAMRPYVDRIAAYCGERCAISAQRVVIREHLDDQRRRATSARILDGSPLDVRWQHTAYELGVPLRVLPAAGLATGIYVDQRATRRWLRQRCEGARVLNLFAYTGLFSTSMLSAGAQHAVSVDLSQPALQLAEENGQLAGVAQRHEIVHSDCLQYCQENTDTFDWIICDPPTAAQGAGGWVARRDYPRLLQALAPRLSAQGRLVACVNTLGKPYDLQRALAENGFRVLSPEQAPQLEADLPQRKGFPEGRPFRLCVAQLA